MPLSAQEEQRLIDKTVQKHSVAILALKYQRNSLASISRLPAEILSHIFFFVKLSRPSFYSRYDTSLAWIQVTHVSTHWRYVAVNSPTLWAEPPLANAKWMVEMLKRSKKAELTINADLTSYVSLKLDRLKEILQNHGSRIQHLTLSGMNFDSCKILQELPVSAPQLKTLHLAASQPDYTNWDDICIPKTILADSGNLRHLDISGCNVHWNRFSLCNVTHLKLHDIAKTARPTSTQFMGALAEMSKLVYLDMKNILDPNIKFTSRSDASSNRIQLLRLQTLTIMSPVAEVETFFQHVTFPSSATVHIRGIPSSNSIPDISVVISSIAQLYSGDEFLALSLRDLEMPYYNFVQFKLFREVIEPLPHFVYAGHVALTLEIAVNSRLETADQIIPELFSNGFPLSKVSQVELGTSITNPDTLTSTIGNLPALSFIRVDTQSGTAFVKALHPHSNAMDAEYFPAYFRNLVSISLSLTFEAKYEYSEITSYDVDLGLLKDCLIQRYECGAEIQQLSLYDCYHLEEQDVWELTHIVANVEWDEIEQDVEPSEEEEEEEEEPEHDYYYDSDDCQYQ